MAELAKRTKRNKFERTVYFFYVLALFYFSLRLILLRVRFRVPDFGEVAKNKNVVTKVIGWIMQVLYYVDISCNGAKMYLVFFVFLICVIDSIKGSPDVVDIRVCRCLFVVCIYIFGWLCRATCCYVASILMLGVSHVIRNKKKL